MRKDKCIHGSIQAYKFLVKSTLTIWRAVLNVWMIYIYGNELFSHYQNNYEVGRALLTITEEVDFIVEETTEPRYYLYLNNTPAL